MSDADMVVAAIYVLAMVFGWVLGGAMFGAGES